MSWPAPTDEFCATYAPAYGGTWTDAAAHLRNDPVESTIVAELAAALRRDGAFQTPVVVDRAEARILNGMHRVVAALDVPDAMLSVCDQLPQTSEMILEAEVTTGEILDDERSAILCSLLRSMPTPDGGWVETDVLSGSGRSYRGLWYWDGPPSVLIEAIATRAGRFGYDVTVAAPEHFDPDRP